jgi:hypothetical protein
MPSGRVPGRVLRVPDLMPLSWRKTGPYVEFRIEPFQDFAMAVVEYT